MTPREKKQVAELLIEISDNLYLATEALRKGTPFDLWSACTNIKHTSHILTNITKLTKDPDGNAV